MEETLPLPSIFSLAKPQGRDSPLFLSVLRLNLTSLPLATHSPLSKATSEPFFPLSHQVPRLSLALCPNLFLPTGSQKLIPTASSRFSSPLTTLRQELHFPGLDGLHIFNPYPPSSTGQRAPLLHPPLCRAQLQYQTFSSPSSPHVSSWEGKLFHNKA